MLANCRQICCRVFPDTGVKRLAIILSVMAAMLIWEYGLRDIL